MTNRLSGFRRWLMLGAMVACLANHHVRADFEEDYERMTWQEIEVQFPPAPDKNNLQAFYVSASTRNDFAIDSASLSIGVDGVVRYILVVETPGGARNVSYEGIRCLTREFRGYASGRADGTWSKSRNSRWLPITNVVANRQHMALFSEYFCPDGVIVSHVDEVITALRAANSTLKEGADRER